MPGEHSGASEKTDQQTDDGQHDENQKQRLGNTGCAGREATKAQHRRHQGDHEKDHGVMQQFALLG